MSNQISGDLFKNRDHKNSSRLLDWDYGRDGLYFITICTDKRKMILNEIGEIVKDFWQEIPKHFPGVYLLEYVVMPNHLHGIIEIRINYEEYKKTGRVNFEFGDMSVDKRCRDAIYGVSKNDLEGTNRDAINRVSTGGATGKHNPMGQRTLGEIIRWLKGRTKFEIHKNFPQPHFSWQANYFEHIIRNQKSLENIIFYIRNNPLYWQWDKNNPINFNQQNEK